MDDQQVVAELHRIATEHNGLLRPSDVVKAARPVASPLHSRFEWDDSEAAQAYRLWQARRLISVTVEYIGEGDEAIEYKVFVSLTSDRNEEGGGYRVTANVMNDPKLRHTMLRDALEEMERFEKKYADLKELAAVFAAMRRTKTKVQGRRELTTA